MANLLNQCRVLVGSASYSVIQAHEPESGHFMTLLDGREVTLIAETGRVDPANIRREESGWRLLTFDAVLPFELTGFLATVTSALAKAGVSVFAVSSYSTDHILVKTERLDAALKALTDLGCTISYLS